MNLLSQMFGGLVSSEQKAESISNTISAVLIEIAKNNNLPHTDVGVFIRPSNAEFDFRVFACRIENNSPKEILSELTVLEIVKIGEKDEDSGEDTN